MFGIPFIYIAIALMVVSSVIQILTTKQPPRPQDAKASGLNDFQFPTVEEGTPQSVIFGDVYCTSWFVLWVGNFRTKAITAHSSGGKK